MTNLHVIDSLYFVAPPELTGQELRSYVDSYVQRMYQALTAAFSGGNVNITYGLCLDEDHVPLHRKVYVDGIEVSGTSKNRIVAILEKENEVLQNHK